MPTHPSPAITNLTELGASLGIDLGSLSITPVGGGTGSGVMPVYNVKTDYAADNTGVSDATTAFQNAENAANATGGILAVPPGTYLWNSVITKKSFVNWIGAGEGATIIKVADTNANVAISGANITTANATTLSAQANAGDRTISVTSATGITVGDYYQISGNSRWFLSRVAAINGTAITLEEKIPFLIPNGTATSRITAWGSEHWSIRGITFTTALDPTQVTTRKNGVIQLNGARDAVVENCEFIGFPSDGGGRVVGCDTGMRIRLNNLTFYNCYDSDPTPTQNSKCTYFLRTRDLIETNMVMRRCGGSKTSGHAQCFNVLYSGNIIGGEGDWGGYAVTTTTGSQSFPLAGSTLNVTSTTGFLLSGTNKAWLALGSPPYTTNPTAFTYTGGTGTTLTGVAGAPGSGSIPAGSVVTATASNMVAGSEIGLPADSGGRGVSWEDWCCNWVCSNNVLHDTGFDGIRADGGINGVIANNTLFNCRDVPIFCTSGNGSSVSSQIIIAHNRVYFSSVNSNNHGISAAGGASELVIVGNIVTNSQSVGIYLTSSNTDCVIADNIVDTSGGRGIRLDAGCTRCSVHGNIVRNATGAAIRTLETSGGNHVYGNIGNTAFEIHASDRQTLDTAANSNWVQ